MATNITIIGYGTMGKAIKKALLDSDKTIKISTIDKGQSNIEAIKKSSFIILAVKPQDSPEVIKNLKDCGIKKDTILISIMAGISIKKLMELSNHKKIVRMMPNLGLSVGAGIAVWKKTGLSNIENKKTKNFIDKITENFEVKDEDTINKVTAISGSGPAYFFLLADYLIKAAEKLGLAKNESERLVRKTLLASALLGKNSNYSTLITKIASKGGTTEAALKVFKNKNLEKITLEVVTSAHKRAKQLSK